MSDCHDAGVCERLPEFLHGRLAAEEAETVRAHLADCGACRAELALLSSARDELAESLLPPIDLAAIVRALPRSRGRPTRHGSPSLPWRLAAAVALMVTGGAAIVWLRSASDGSAGRPVVAADTHGLSSSRGPGARPAPTRVAVETAAAGRRRGEFGAVDVVTDLDEVDLEALIDALEGLEAAPLATPETLPARRIVGEFTGVTGE